MGGGEGLYMGLAPGAGDHGGHCIAGARAWDVLVSSLA